MSNITADVEKTPEAVVQPETEPKAKKPAKTAKPAAKKAKVSEKAKRAKKAKPGKKEKPAATDRISTSSLEDAYLALTGSTIRDESVSVGADQMKQFEKMWNNRR